MAGTIISGVIFCIVAMIMIGIGVSQLKSKEPVGFYTGEKPPKVDQLSDVNSWYWLVDLFCVYWRRQHILRDSVMYRHDYSYSDYGISSSQMGEKVFYTINCSLST